MKIDIHTHTKRCKSGDPATREVSAQEFCEIVLSTDVRIVAITNHNHFDLSQFREIAEGMGDEVHVWPGIELDVEQDGAAGHLLVVASPQDAEQFANAVEQLIGDTPVDDFSASVAQILEAFDSLGPIYVAHYDRKKPNISEDSLKSLTDGTAHATRVLKEVTNSISAGIYIAHGHPSIYGSDVRDWASYTSDAQDLPELRLPVDGFEHFCLLLEKDPNTINTAMDQKTSEGLILTPFDDTSSLTLTAYNDINVIFGSKGTGKSCILDAVERHYRDRGVEAEVYKSASEKLEEIFDVQGRLFTPDPTDLGFSDCADELELLRHAQEAAVTSLRRYRAFFQNTKSTRNAQKILIRDLDPEELGTSKRTLDDSHSAASEVDNFMDFLAEDEAVAEVLADEELRDLMSDLGSLSGALRNRVWATFRDWKTGALLNSAIESFRQEVARKTGTAPKPSSPGFREYAANRIQIAAAARTLRDTLETEIAGAVSTIGSLGPDKGTLELRTEIRFQRGKVTDGDAQPVGRARKRAQKKVASFISTILDHAFADDLFQVMADFNAIEDGSDVVTASDLLLFKRYFALQGAPYTPSSGEASMVMLQKELNTDRDVYILDEPEKSLGHEYISDVIVPLIRQRAKEGKKLFVATHDANIAVRTLPFCSVYRFHGPDGYRTYVGNPFSNNLVNTEDPEDQLDWKRVSMRTLEGGEEAFGERGAIYGKS